MFGLRHEVIFLAQCWRDPEGRPEALSQKIAAPISGRAYRKYTGWACPFVGAGLRYALLRAGSQHRKGHFNGNGQVNYKAKHPGAGPLPPSTCDTAIRDQMKIENRSLRISKKHIAIPARQPGVAIFRRISTTVHNGPLLKAMGLQIVELTAEEVAFTQAARSAAPTLSFPDCFALSCARCPQHMLITSTCRPRGSCGGVDLLTFRLTTCDRRTS